MSRRNAAWFFLPIGWLAALMAAQLLQIEALPWDAKPADFADAEDGFIKLRGAFCVK